jgi:hypothetical protein
MLVHQQDLARSHKSPPPVLEPCRSESTNAVGPMSESPASLCQANLPYFAFGWKDKYTFVEGLPPSRLLPFRDGH